MKRAVIFFVVAFIVAAAIVSFIRWRIASSQTGEAVLKIQSLPHTTIFLDNQNIGTTPYEAKHEPGEYILKLIPETTVDSVVSWEGKISLSPNLLTYVNRELAETELTSQGEILALERIGEKGAQIAVVSTPDNAQVTLGDENKGKTPLLIQDVDPGNYELTVGVPGYMPRTVKIKTTAGHKLNAIFQLAKTADELSQVLPPPDIETEIELDVSPEPSTSPGPQATSPASADEIDLPARPYIEILDTPTGFLRVRDAPSTASGKEVGRVEPGDYFALLDEENGWYEIEYESGETGWVSGQYADKYE